MYDRGQQTITFERRLKRSRQRPALEPCSCSKQEIAYSKYSFPVWYWELLKVRQLTTVSKSEWRWLLYSLFSLNTTVCRPEMHGILLILPFRMKYFKLMRYHNFQNQITQHRVDNEFAVCHMMRLLVSTFSNLCNLDIAIASRREKHIRMKVA